MADTVQIRLAPAHDGDALEQSRERERVCGNEAFRRFPCVHVDDIDAAARRGPVVVELGAAGKQQRAVPREKSKVRVAFARADMAMIGLVESFDQKRHCMPRSVICPGARGAT